MNQYEQIYKNLCKIAPGFIEKVKSNPYITGKSTKPEDGGLMSICFEGRGLFDGLPMISLAHYHTQNGDLMSDPFMEIIIHEDMQVAEAQTFEMSNPPCYCETYIFKDGKKFVHTKNKKENNSFLLQWTRSLINQGHVIVFPVGETQEELEARCLGEQFPGQLVSKQPDGSIKMFY